ncbi:armadillo-type protein [Cladochytrium replicatum]|nr:armadillo-type protein [Cladochytrium replicatum]
METQLEEIEKAALLAFNQNELHSQAISFINQLKLQPDGVWQICLALFLKKPPRSVIARHLALQILEALLLTRYEILSLEEGAILRQALWEWAATVELQNEEPAIRNKFGLVLALLFKHQYLTVWQSFFDEMLALLAGSVGTPRETSIMHLFLQVCFEIDGMIVAAPTTPGNLEAKTIVAIKDSMRETGAVAKLVDAWYSILISRYQTNEDIAKLCLSCFGQYVSWADISLIVTPRFIETLYAFMRNENLRESACACLEEIVSKGMQPADRLALIEAINLVGLLSDLDFENGIEFTTAVAQLLNRVGIELTSAWSSSDTHPQTKDEIVTVINKFFPSLLRMVRDEHDDVTTDVLDFVRAYVSLIRKKFSAGPLSSPHQENIGALLEAIIFKMKYDEESSPKFADQADEDDAMFDELRISLKDVFCQIAAICKDDFVAYVTSMLSGTFNQLILAQNTGKSFSELMTWSEAEVALYVLYIFPESIKVVSYPEESPLTQLFSLMLRSNISAYPHISIPIIYFDAVSRYSRFFEAYPDYIPSVLESFVDARGLHHSNRAVRNRVDNLFLQFIKEIKLKVAPFADVVLDNIQDLLNVFTPENMDNDVNNASFNNHCFLFEAVGLLIAFDVNKHMTLLKAISSPLLGTIQNVLEKELYKLDTPPENIYSTQVHRSIVVLGNVFKGLPENLKPNVVEPPWVELQKETAVLIVRTLDVMSDYQIIRDAAKHTFQRMVASMGYSMLPFVVPYVKHGLLLNSTPETIAGFVPFFESLAYNFKSAILSALHDFLTPFLERVFYFANQVATGFDAQVQLTNLKRSYLRFLVSVFCHDLMDVFVSEVNYPQLPTVLQSVLAYSLDNSDPETQAIAFSVFALMVEKWIEPKLDGTVNILPGLQAEIPNGTGKKGMVGSANGADSNHVNGTSKRKQNTKPLPGFEQFVYENMVRAAFEAPLKPDFQWTDAKSRTVIAKISEFHKVVASVRGAEYFEYVTGTVLTSLSVPPQEIQRFAILLRDGKKKDLADCLAAILKQIPQR